MKILRVVRPEAVGFLDAGIKLAFLGILCLALILMSSVRAQAGENLLSNPDFEEKGKGWKTAGGGGQGSAARHIQMGLYG